MKVAAGDKLLLQANTVGKRFINGELVEVRAIQGDSVVLADGRVIPQNYRTFTHGYAVTSHAAQGKTVDEVLVVASSRSLAAVHQQQFYVSISRGRERCQVLPMIPSGCVRMSPIPASDWQPWKWSRMSADRNSSCGSWNSAIVS